LEEAHIEYRAEWKTFKHDSEQAIEANEKRIVAFQQKMEQAGADTKAKYSEDVSALEQKNRDLKRKLADYKDEGRSKWEKFKANFSQDIDGIGKTMRDLFKD
jgi:small-conductance mechanosensitive channel